MDEWVNDAATIGVGFVLVVLILRLTALCESSTGSNSEAHRLLRAVSAQWAKPQSDVIVLNKCIDLSQERPGCTQRCNESTTLRRHRRNQVREVSCISHVTCR
jgi:hypothetical protein